MKKYMRKHKMLMGLTIVCYALSAMFSIATAFVIKGIVNAGTGHNGQLLINYLILGVVLCILFIIIKFSGYTARNIFWRKTSTELKNDMVGSILEMSMNDFNKSNSGKYISMLNNDVRIFEQDYVGSIPELVSNICLVLGTMVALIYVSPELTIAAAVVCTIPMLLPIIFGKTLTRHQEATTRKAELYNINLKDIFSGFELIKSYGISERIKKNSRKWNEKLEEEQGRYRKFEAITNASSEGLTQFVFFVLLIYAMYLVVNDRLTLGTTAAAVQLLNYLVFPIRDISAKMGKIKASKKVCERLENILSKPTEGNSKENKEVINEKFNSIQIKDLTYSYENTDRPTLSNINLSFQAGKKYAIVGTSGSGKSTLLKLILNYYSSYQGKILLNTSDIKALDDKCLYHYVSMIHQNVFLFDDTIKNNITLFDNYDMDKVMDAIENAGLRNKMDQVVNGIDYNVDESGMSLSGGERQRIAIARAFIRDTSVLLLDEATSGLDNKTAYQIESVLIEKKALTAIIVTHKLSEGMLKNYDEIIVMKSGKVVEQGTFDELMARKEEFYSLYRVAN